jgi:hypothetical protein
MRKAFALLTTLVLCTLLSPAVFGQGNSAENRAEVMRPTHFDTSSRPLREMFERGEKPGPARGGRDFEPGRPQAVGNTNPAGVDPLVQRNNATISAYAQPKAGTTGVGVDPNYRVSPPDTTGDLGPNHYVQWVNLRYAVYDVVRDAAGQLSTFQLRAGFPKNGNVIWQGFGGRCETDNDGDPIVQYDQFNDRWVVTQFAVSSTPYTQCVAVSKTGDPTGEYHRYAYSFGRDFNDFPKMSVWSDGYYITYNMFRGGRTFSGANVCALERDKMLTGAAARQICVLTTASASFLPADIEGTNLPPAGSANPLLTINSTSLLAWRYKVNWTTGTAALTGPTTVPGVTFSRACGGGACITQPGTTQLLDSLGDRLNYRLSYRNFLTHEAMVVTHPVATGGTSGLRWYELRNALGQTLGGAAPVVHQQGTFSPDSTYRWMGSAAIDKTGGIAIGYNVSSKVNNIAPSIRYAYRGPGDVPGALGNETNILVGGGSQLTNLARWGDYSTVSIDPVDGCTMVYTTEYLPANGTYNWTTYIYSFKLSTCQ